MRKLKTRALLVCLFSLLPAAGAAQPPPVNADSIEVYGVLLIAGIDKFEYGPNEYLEITMQIVNTSGSSMPFPNGVAYASPLTFVDDTWCPFDSSECLSYSWGEFSNPGFHSIPPGTTTFYPCFYMPWGPPAGSWIHTLGRVRFWDPWGYPWTEGSSFELAVEFHRSPLVGVETFGWGVVKQLYR